MNLNISMSKNINNEQLRFVGVAEPGYPKVLCNDNIILDGSNAEFGVAYIDQEGVEPIEAEIFLPPYSGGDGDLTVAPLDGRFKEIPITIESGPNTAFSEEEILTIAQKALAFYYLRNYRQPALVREMQLEIAAH